MEVKPLFFPLYTEHYERFKDGSKGSELRLYGKRYNEQTCFIGRAVILSKGYGKRNRMTGKIWQFQKCHGSTFNSIDRAAIINIYGSIDVLIACIFIRLD